MSKIWTFCQPRVDNRRLEVVADGWPLFHGAQLAVDTTMVSQSWQTELPGGNAQNGMEPLWTKPVAPESAPTQN